MFRANPQTASAQEKFREAAENFLQNVDFTEEEQPWALMLLNTMGTMIEQNAKQHNPALQGILIKQILEDVEYTVTEGKYAANQHCAAFATAIRAYINHLNQLNPAEGAAIENNTPMNTDEHDNTAEGAAPRMA